LFVLTSKLSQISAAALLCLTSATVSADETQRLSVELTEDGAVLRAVSHADYWLVEATLDALQESGKQDFTLRVMKTSETIGFKKPNYSTAFFDGTAKLQASPDVPNMYLLATIGRLVDLGIPVKLVNAPERLTRELETAIERAARLESPSRE